MKNIRPNMTLIMNLMYEVYLNFCTLDLFNLPEKIRKNKKIKIIFYERIKIDIMNIVIKTIQ